MKNKYLKPISVILCVALVLAGGSATVRAVNSDKEAKNTKNENIVTEKKKTETFENGNMFYVFSDVEGSAKKVMVSDENGGFVESDLTKQTNESGTVKENLPIDMKISYEIDGKSVSADQLSGKSGHFKMKIDYTNNMKETVMIKGQEEEMYVPFVVMTGVLFDNKNFKNIEITNGKMLDDGEHTSVMCFALPGLQDNFKIERGDLDIPESIEISADVKDFEMSETMTLATNEIFSEIDDSKIKKADDLEQSLDQLKDAMNQLMDGSSALYDGLDLLLEKSGQLKSGVMQLAEGSSSLVQGISELNNGVTALQSGSSKLSQGLAALSSNNEVLTGGAATTFQAILQSANDQIAAAGVEIPKLTIENYAGVLNQVISSLDKDAVYEQALSQVTQGVNAQRGAVEAAVTDAVTQKVTAQVTQAVLAQLGIEAAPDQQLPPNVQAVIDGKVKETMESEQIQGEISKNTELKIQQIISEKMASEEVQSKFTQASAGAQKLMEVKTLLDNYNAFYNGIITYTNGVKDAANGAAALNDGASSLQDGVGKLSAGAGELNQGMQQLKDQTPDLIDGVSQLKEGSMKLSDGLKEFNEKGIKKLTDSADQMDGLLERVRTMIQLSKEYQPFDGAGNEQLKMPVRFLYRTDCIESK